jgi:hypothetical protein
MTWLKVKDTVGGAFVRSAPAKARANPSQCTWVVLTISPDETPAARRPSGRIKRITAPTEKVVDRGSNASSYKQYSSQSYDWLIFIA